MNYKLTFISDELIFALWFWLVPFTKIFALTYGKSQFQTVAVATVILLIIGFIKSIRIYRAYFFIITVWIILIVSYLIHDNYYTLYYVTKFSYYSAVSVYFLSRVKNIKKCLLYMGILAITALLLYIGDPSNGYKLTNNYMEFGFLIGLPSFLCIRIVRKYLGVKYFIPFECVAFLSVFLYSNRSSVLSIIGFYILEGLFLEKKSRRYKVIKLSSIFTVAFLFYLNLKLIIETLVEIISFKYGYSSRILMTLYRYFQDKSVNGLTAGRLDLWDRFYDIFSRNIFFGSQIAIYEKYYNIYIHNILMDFLMQLGIIGTIFLLFLIVYSFLNILKLQYFAKIFGLMLFSLWFPKLIFSSSFWLDSYFWMFLCYGLFNKTIMIKISKGEIC